MYAVILLPFGLWLLIVITLPSARIEFDFDQTHGTFLLIYQNYARISEGVFLAGFVMFYKYGTGGSGAAFLAAAIYSLLFRVWVLSCYESYMHTKYPKTGSPGHIGPTNYGPYKYAATLSLGISSVVTLIYAAAISR